MIVVVRSANETTFIVSFAEHKTTQLPDLLIDSQLIRENIAMKSYFAERITIISIIQLII